MKTRLVGDELFHVDGQMGRQTWRSTPFIRNTHWTLT